LEVNFWGLVAAIILAGLAYLLNRVVSQAPTPVVHYSDLKDVQQSNWKVRLSRWTKPLFFTALAFFLAALANPHFYIQKEASAIINPQRNPTEGIAIYLALDQSGSMSEKINRTQTKIDLVKTVSSEFVKQRPDDLIGLIFFARTAQVTAPLTLDHQAILNELAKFHNVNNQEDDGTAIGYAIFKAANLIAATKHYANDLIGKGQAAYDIKNSILVVVTDGLQDPSLLDEGNRLRFMSLEEAAGFAKEQGVKVYLINVDPQFNSAQYEPHRKLMKRITELTGGRFYLLDTSTSLNQVFADINKLEKSKIVDPLLNQGLSKEEQPNLYRKVMLYPYLLAMGLFLLGSLLLLNTSFLRKIP
jgi:Ca-activated chloride channel family protein